MRRHFPCLASIGLLLGVVAPGFAQPADRPKPVPQVGHWTSAQAAAFSPDGRWILTASVDNVAILWDAASGQELRRFVGHPGNIFIVAFSPDGRVALTTGHGGTVSLLWDV